MPPSKIALLTDSCADLSPALIQEYDIRVVPLRIRCDDGEYADGIDITPAEVCRRLRAGEQPQTSLPPGADFTAALDAIAADGYDGVIAVMLSSGLSGTYNLARLAAEEHPLPAAVFDSRSGSMGQSLTLLQMAEDIRAGMGWEELTSRRVPWLLQHTHPFFSVDTLEYLRRGGRIGRVTATAGTLLHIKPILGFAPDGQLQSVAKARGRDQVIDKLVELAAQAGNGCRRYNLAVANGGAPEAMEEVHARLTAALPNCEHIWSGEINSTFSVYIGDGVLGAAIQVLE